MRSFFVTVRAPGTFGATLWGDTVEARDAAHARQIAEAEFSKPTPPEMEAEAPEFFRLIEAKRVAALASGFVVVARPSKAKR